MHKFSHSGFHAGFQAQSDCDLKSQSYYLSLYSNLPLTSEITCCCPHTKQLSCVQTSFANIPASTVIIILSFLDASDINIFGCTSIENYKSSQHPLLWTNIDIKSPGGIDIKTITRLVSRTSVGLPLQKLSVIGFNIDLGDLYLTCSCLHDEVCRTCSVLRGLPLNVEQPKVCIANTDKSEDFSFSHLMCSCGRHESCSSCNVLRTIFTYEEYDLCESCSSIKQIENKFATLQELRLYRPYWLGSCSMRVLLEGCKNLTSLSVAHNINVNDFVCCVASSCPALTSINFKYVQPLSVEKSLWDGQKAFPVLHTSAVIQLTKSCRMLNIIKFRHYTVNEESANELVRNLPYLREVDFCDNESLHGYFLDLLIQCSPELTTLCLRDCTEMEETRVAAFVRQILMGACPLLTSIDMSCQWSFFNDSLVDSDLREELSRLRPALRWREDQCEIAGFGIDPEEGIDSVKCYHIEQSDRSSSSRDRDFPHSLSMMQS
eukprot:gene2040-3964_t